MITYPYITSYSRQEHVEENIQATCDSSKHSHSSLTQKQDITPQTQVKARHVTTATHL